MGGEGLPGPPCDGWGVGSDVGCDGGGEKPPFSGGHGPLIPVVLQTEDDGSGCVGNDVGADGVGVGVALGGIGTPSSPVTWFHRSKPV